MADGDAGHGYGDSLEVVGVKFKIEPDKKAKKESEQAANNMIGLIADLAIIGKVAGDVLNKLWEGMQESIGVGIEEFKDISSALNFDVDPKEFLALKFALGQIGVEGSKATDILGEMDDIIQRFRNKATGPEKIGEVLGKLAKQGISDDAYKAVEEAIASQDPMELMKALVGTQDELGKEFSNFITDIGLPELANLEQLAQFQDFFNALDKSDSILFEVDVESLDALSDGTEKLKQAATSLKTAFAEDLGPFVEDLGDIALKVTEAFLSWKDAYKEETSAEKKDVLSNLSTSAILLQENKITKWQDLLNLGLGSVDAFNAILPGNWSEFVGTTATDSYGVNPYKDAGYSLQQESGTNVTIENIIVSTEVPEDIPESVAEAIRASLGG